MSARRGANATPLEWWKASFGLCVVCGTPLGLEHGRRVQRENADEDEGLDPELLREMMDQDGGVASALEEAPVRVALFRFNMLGRMEQCHVIDRYTSLQPRTETGDRGRFLALLRDNPELVARLGGDLRGDITTKWPGQQQCDYDSAVDVCRRLVEAITVPGCRTCNSAMNRYTEHSKIAYLCFPPTASLKAPELALATVKSNALKKMVQQVALFFAPPAGPGGRWHLKSDIDIVLDAVIYRCVTNLVMWGRTGWARYRMVAVFYGAWYMHEVRGLRDASHGFIRWHMHVFRPFYMERYPDPGTWFGLTQQMACVRFDTTRLQGLEWVRWTTARLDEAADAAVDYMRESVNALEVDRFHRCMLAAVSNERTLFAFACRRMGVEEGVATVFAFYKYNVDDPRSMALFRRVTAAIKAVQATLRRELTAKDRRGGRRDAQPEEAESLRAALQRFGV